MFNHKKYFSIISGTAILAFGMFNIHARTAISEGGVLGLTLLIYNWFKISPAVSGIILDLLAYTIGFMNLQKDFLKDSIIASISYSLFYRLYEHIGYFLPDLSNLPLVASIVGALFVGVGVGLVVKYDCAAGGDDALALVFSKLTKKKISVFYVMSDYTILLLSLSYIPLNKIIYSLITVTLSSKIIDLFRVKKV